MLWFNALGFYGMSRAHFASWYSCSATVAAAVVDPNTLAHPAARAFQRCVQLPIVYACCPNQDECCCKECACIPLAEIHGGCPSWHAMPGCAHLTSFHTAKPLGPRRQTGQPVCAVVSPCRPAATSHILHVALNQTPQVETMVQAAVSLQCLLLSHTPECVGHLRLSILPHRNFLEL